jgi:uncharacterized protein
MNIAIAGGTGFIGRSLVRYLTGQGHRVAVVSRSEAKDSGVLTWSRLKRDEEAREGWEAIINLAGESISQRWTSSAKKRIIESRIAAARQVEQWVTQMTVKPRVVINSSGVSIYGTSLTEEFDESAVVLPSDFLSGVAASWEEAADRIPVERLVKLRTGMVLGAHGGALPSMTLPYKLGAGGRMGSGKQWMSWIHLEDMVRVIDFVLHDSRIAGPVNAVSPHPVTNDDFGRALGHVLGRPHWLPVPSPAIQLVLGELSELLLKGQKVLPAQLERHGFSFRYPEVELAFKEIFQKKAE